MSQLVSRNWLQDIRYADRYDMSEAGSPVRTSAEQRDDPNIFPMLIRSSKLGYRLRAAVAMCALKYNTHTTF